MYKTTFMLAIAAISVLAPGCGPPATQERAGIPAGKSVAVKGSDTMVHLVTAWTESYTKAHPDAEISVTGGGSGTGIAALMNKTTDICAASRSMSPEEKSQASQKGITLKESVVARDGIAVVVNPSNPINELTLEQIKKIYTGAYTNWGEVGGNSGEFVVLSRESSSGTYVFFQEHVLNKEDYTPRARLMPATSAVIQSVETDAPAIGYVGLGYAEQAGNRVKIIEVKADANAPAIAPSEATVRDGTYSVSRPLYFYTGADASPLASDFIQFCLAQPGQTIVRQEGYVPVG
jgi:phosphate transport system substrate-binding protein